jgi:hypothetical protein
MVALVEDSYHLSALHIRLVSVPLITNREKTGGRILAGSFMGTNLPRRGRCGVLTRREDRRAERLGAELRGFRNGDRQTIAAGRDIRGELDDQLTIGMALDLEHAVTQGDDGRTLAEVPAGDDQGTPVGVHGRARDHRRSRGVLYRCRKAGVCP